MKSFQELTVWQKSMLLVEEVYRLLRKFPEQEQYALTDQLRRSVVSIPSNIAEGYGRNAKNDFIRFLNIARGSKYEVETQLLIAKRLGYVTESDLTNALKLCDETGKMLNALIKKLTND
jgi:four helix bundle protein